MLLSLVALLGAAAGMSADGPVKKYDGGWNLYKSADNCALLRSYEGDTLLSVAYYPKEDIVRVSVIDGQLKDVVDGGDYEFELYFMKDYIGKTWGMIKFKGAKIPDVGSGYKFAVSGKAFLADMKNNDLMGIMKDGDVIESLKLDSVSGALVGLETCSRGLG